MASPDIKHLAQLARLSFSEQESLQIQSDIGQVLDYVQQLQTLELDGVQPTSHVMDVHSVLRQDVRQSGLTTEKAFLNAPDVESDYFKVPQIMTEDE